MEEAEDQTEVAEVVEEEVEERYCGLGPLPLGASAARASKPRCEVPLAICFDKRLFP